MKNELYEINHLWAYTVRQINPHTFTISYITKDGFRTEEEAKKQQALDEETYQKTLNRIKSSTNIKYTFTEFLEYWFDNIYFVANDTSTKVIQHYVIQNLILPNVKNDVLMAYITSDYLNEIIDKCSKISVNSGYSYKKTLRLMLKDAEDYKLIKKEVRNNLKNIPTPQNKMELPSMEDLRKLLTEAQNHPIYYFEILLALFAGLRQGEILALKYSDFDRDAQTVQINKQYTRSYSMSKISPDKTNITNGMVTREPKSSSDRILKIPAFLFDVLEEKKRYNKQLLKKAKEKGVRSLPKDYVCVSFYGKRKTASCLTPALKRISTNAGVKPMKMHMLRHCFATLMIENGVSLQDVANCMGHSSISTTFNTYCGICEARNQARQVMDSICPTVSMDSLKEVNGHV